MTDTLEKKKINRFKFLKALYDETDGHPHALILERDLAKLLNMNEDESDKIVHYLDREGLLEMRTLNGGISITHAGVKQIEQALSKPSEPTEYFPAINYINIGTMYNSQIQQGTFRSTQNQSVSASQLESALNDFLKAVNESTASEDQKENAEICKEVLLSQSKVPKEQRDTPLIKRTWDRLGKLNTSISLGKAGFATYTYLEPLIRGYFGI